MNTENSTVDLIGQAYIRLAFLIEQHIRGFVDAYFGPPEWKEQAEAEGKLSIGELRRRAETLLQEVDTHTGMEALRQEWLSKQITAMITVLRLQEGETLPFEKEIKLIYDIQPPKINEREFEDALQVISDLLPGAEPLAERLEAWDKQFEIPRGKILTLMERCRDETQRRTRQIFKLPESEEISLHLVEGQPWAAYNWYLGNYRSRVEFNTDLPTHANHMITLMTHEGYPGHHTEHVIKENCLYHQQGHAEACIQLINAPECLVSEGIADLAWQIIFIEQDLKTWLREEFYPLAGIDPTLVARDRVIAHARRKLRGVSSNAAFLLHSEGADEQTVVNYLERYEACTAQEAHHTFRFLSTPLYRSYIFNYYHGRELLSQYVEAGDPVVRFQTLLEQPLTPSRIEQWIKASKIKL